MDLNRFQQDKEINPSQLDLECTLQADRFFHWAKAAVAASHEVDRARLYLDAISAQLEVACRQNPGNFGLVKATDAAVDAGIKNHLKYQEAVEQLNEARKDSKLLDAAVSTLEQKKRMLEMLVVLHGQQYFAGPSVPRDLVSTWKKHQDRLKKSNSKLGPEKREKKQ